MFAPRAADLVRIEPADRSVAAPIDDVHPTADVMLENHYRSARQIEFGDGGGDRKGFELLGSFRHDDGIEAPRGFFVLLRRLHNIIGDTAQPGPRKAGVRAGTMTGPICTTAT